ncbi:MAG: hypothetical protein RLZZ265_2475, partial [Verrucomicrobiota bacterium]
MNPFPAYLHEQLEEKLKERRVVVWYDPNREFAPFVEALIGDVDGHGLKQVMLGALKTGLSVFQGSYFALRMQLEASLSENRPKPLLIYLPDEKRDARGSVLMEWEKAGITWEPQMKRLARNVMRERFSDGVIDDMLAPAGLTYHDVVALLAENEGRNRSLLDLALETTDIVAATAMWVADAAHDKRLVEKGAVGELIKLVENRAGFRGLIESELASGRQRFIRYLLLSEFREDLRCEPPAALAMIPHPSLKDQREFCRKVLDHLRTRHMAIFQTMADTVETEFGLAEAGIQARNLGSIDTFRFEEKAVLYHCSEVLADGDYSAARSLVTVHSGSFWARLDFSRRQAQWEVCDLLASLGTEVAKVEGDLAKLPANTTSRDLVKRYVAEGGWHRMDLLHRRLEGRLARMEEEPETEKSLNLLRAKVENALRVMANRFGQALERDKWTVADTLHQTRIWATQVAPLSGKVAVFFVDAMRFELGSDFATQISEAKDLKIEAAISVLPSITPLGMAALLPGAAESYSVVEFGGKLAAKVDGQPLVDVKARMDHLKARVPDATDITLERLLQDSPSKVQTKIGNARVVIVRSQELDSLGEKSELLARNLMDTATGNLARAVRRLAGMGFERFVLTADHGHQFSARKDDDQKVEAPSGGTLELHRRCWIGRGAGNTAGTVRVKAPELGYDSNLEFAFPSGLGVFLAGGGLAYHHGGFTLQEMVIPVISFRMKPAGTEVSTSQVRISEHPESVTNRIFSVRLDLEADLVNREPVVLRVLLINGGEEVGRAGMAHGAEFDQKTESIILHPGGSALVGLRLNRDDVTTIRVVVQAVITGGIL